MNAKRALKESVQDLVDAGVKTTFTKKRLTEMGIDIPNIKMTPAKIREIRSKTGLSQSIFAKLLNVSIASIRHWEQGLREPGGSARVLLDLLSRNPHVLDYQFRNSKAAL